MDVERLLEPEEAVALRRRARTSTGCASTGCSRARLPFASRTRIAGWIRAGRARIDGVDAARAAAPRQRGPAGRAHDREAPARRGRSRSTTCSRCRCSRAATAGSRSRSRAGVPCHPAGNEIKRTLLTALALGQARERSRAGRGCRTGSTARPPGSCWWRSRRRRSARSRPRSRAATCGASTTRACAATPRDTFRWRSPSSSCAAASCACGASRRRASASIRPASPRTRACDWSRAAADASELELEPVTGRQHQLRVHLAHLGHPIVGDPLYDPRRRGRRTHGAPRARADPPARRGRKRGAASARALRLRATTRSSR